MPSTHAGGGAERDRPENATGGCFAGAIVVPDAAAGTWVMVSSFGCPTGRPQGEAGYAALPGVLRRSREYSNHLSGLEAEKCSIIAIADLGNSLAVMVRNL